MASRLVQAAVAAVVVAGAAAAGWWATHRTPALPNSAEIGAEEAAFSFSECKARLLDGSPAIAVMFTTEGKPVTARQFTTGEMFIVRLRVKASQTIKDGLVVDRIPAGFEIENLNLSQGPQAGEFTVEGTNIAQANANERIVHTEYRDDRFVAAASLGQPLELFYLVRAVTPGRYVVPATFAEDMYRPEVRGIGKAEGEITVVDKK